MEVFERTARRRGLFRGGGFSLPVDPVGMGVNWGNSLLAGLAFLFLPMPNGTYFDVVRGRRMTFSGSPITPTLTAFGLAYAFGTPAGGTNVFGVCGDPTLQPPSAGVSIAAGVFNQAAVTAAGVTSIANFQNPAVTDQFGIYIQVESGVPRFQSIVEEGGTFTACLANGGAGITMATLGQYMSFAASYNGTTINSDYQTTGLGHNTGSVAAAEGIPIINQTVISDASGADKNLGRTLLWSAGWFRPLATSELQTVTSSIGGLPPNALRRR